MLLIAENASLAHDASHARALLKLDPMQIWRVSQIESGGFPGGLKSIAALPRRAMITLPRTNLLQS
jgi:hypothetical protein